jgi:hypothetical protein
MKYKVTKVYLSSFNVGFGFDAGSDNANSATLDLQNYEEDVTNSTFEPNYELNANKDNLVNESQVASKQLILVFQPNATKRQYYISGFDCIEDNNPDSKFRCVFPAGTTIVR